MSSLCPGLHAQNHALSLQIPQNRDLTRQANPRRNLSLMRKYEVAALLPNGDISTRSHIAPATPLFEDCASAFARGTLLPTPLGPIAIEDLAPGDMVTTTEGDEPVLWIGSTSFVPGREDVCTTLTRLTRITADAHGYGRPAMDLLVGPGARMVIRHAKLERLLGRASVLAPVSDYVDGDRYLEITPAGTVDLYHLMLGRHTTLPVGGVEFETYHPGKTLSQLSGESMRKLFLSMFPNVGQIEAFGQLRQTRTSREVIESLLDT